MENLSTIFIVHNRDILIILHKKEPDTMTPDELQKFRVQTAERIRYMREDANLTHEKLSEKTGISIEHLIQWESTDCGELPIHEAKFLCDVFPISVNTLFADMDLTDFKKLYQHLKDFQELPEHMQEILHNTLRDTPLSEHTEEEFLMSLFGKLTNGDEEACKKHIEKFRNYYTE